MSFNREVKHVVLHRISTEAALEVRSKPQQKGNSNKVQEINLKHASERNINNKIVLKWIRDRITSRRFFFSMWIKIQKFFLYLKKKKSFVCVCYIFVVCLLYIPSYR